MWPPSSPRGCRSRCHARTPTATGPSLRAWNVNRHARHLILPPAIVPKRVLLLLVLLLRQVLLLLLIWTLLLLLRGRRRGRRHLLAVPLLLLELRRRPRRRLLHVHWVRLQRQHGGRRTHARRIGRSSSRQVHWGSAVPWRGRHAVTLAVTATPWPTRHDALRPARLGQQRRAHHRTPAVAVAGAAAHQGPQRFRPHRTLSGSRIGTSEVLRLLLLLAHAGGALCIARPGQWRGMRAACKCGLAGAAGEVVHFAVHVRGPLRCAAPLLLLLRAGLLQRLLLAVGVGRAVVAHVHGAYATVGSSNEI